MATFEEIFGTIRSLLHAPSCLIAETLVTHMNKLAALDEQRCIDEVCPYVQQALEHNPIPRDDQEFLPYDSSQWQCNMPSLFNNTVYWPTEEEELELCIYDAPNHTIELIIEENDIQCITRLVNKPWRHQIWGMCFFETLTMEQLAVMARQPSWPHLVHLTLFGNIQLSMLQRLTSMQMFQHLQCLDLHIETGQEPWTDAHTACLNALTDLHSLGIENNDEEDISLQALTSHPNIANMQSLSCLNLTDCEILFQKPTHKLHTLHLSGCLSSQQLTQLTSTICAPKLEDLSLMYTFTLPDVKHAIAPLLTPHLKKIQLNHTHIHENNIDTLIQSGALTSLEYIAMAWCALDTNTASRLFEHLSGDYTHLLFHANTIDPRALNTLTSNTAIQSIQRLYLPSNPLEDGVADVLKRAHWLDTLETLCLHETQLRDPKIGSFLTHPALTKLNHVTLYDNALDDDFCHELTQREPAWHGIHLKLENNQIGPEGLKHLARWPGLQHINVLDLSNNTFDTASLRALGESSYVAAIPSLYLGSLSKAHQQVVQDSKHFNAQTKERVLQYTV